MITGDRRARDRVTRRLDRVAGPDGMLPESYSPETGRWLARHWFAWPGAAFGAVYLLWRNPRHPWRDGSGSLGDGRGPLPWVR